MNFSQLYNILEESIKPTDEDDKDSIIEKIKQQGWSYLGRGMYGIVFGHPDKNYVLKLFNDKGYSFYLEFIKKHSDNPHVVKIKEIISDGFGINKKWKLVAIEKLNPIKFPNWVDYIASYYSSFLDNGDDVGNDFYNTLENFEKYLTTRSKSDISFYQSIKLKNNINNTKKAVRRLYFFIENYLDLFRILFELNKFKNSTSYSGQFDLHTGNFMKRPSTGEIVVTDPLC